MNLKTAKLLRAIVRKNAESREKPIPERAYVQNNRSGTVIVSPGTVRGMYRQLKKAYKSGRVKFNALSRANRVPA